MVLVVMVSMGLGIEVILVVMVWMRAGGCNVDVGRTKLGE